MEHFTTTQLAAKYGRDNSSIANILKNHGFKPVGYGDHNVHIWDEKADEFIAEFINSIETLSANQYAKELGIKATDFKSILNRLGIYSYQGLHRSKKINEAVETYKKSITKTKSIPLEVMKKLHPLVTDERCFNLNYWPDTEPKCFKDLGND